MHPVYYVNNTLFYYIFVINFIHLSSVFGFCLLSTFCEAGAKLVMYEFLACMRILSLC